jgi:hypothetical protein
MFKESRVLVTNPKALAEVLVQRNYEFIKPPRIRMGLGRLLGIGILLAEGDEHKVCLNIVYKPLSPSELTLCSARESC